MKDLKPTFEPLSPETILNHVEEQKQLFTKEQNPFPVDVFPLLVQKSCMLFLLLQGTPTRRK